MKRITWKKHHKWFGILFCFFMLMFCLSGIVLNHREVVADIDISRSCLPASYRFSAWNGGLLRGTLCHTDEKTVKHVFVYGNSGIWQTTPSAKSFTDFNEGFPEGADYRNIKGMVQTPDGSLLVAAQFGLYRHDGAKWTEVPLPLGEGERLSDITVAGDTVVVTGRSFLYMATAPYREFRQIVVKAPAGYDGKVSLLRTVWLLHSGELFGLAGKLLMDAVAVVFILLCLTGMAYWLLPGYIRKIRRMGKPVRGSTRLLKGSLNWHNKLGRYTFIVLLFVTFTGWCLRPPVLIALVHGKVMPVPGTMLDTPNAWNDKLRMLRYDDAYSDWLLSTSEGFYRLASPDDVPVKVKKAPPVSVMGLNVWQKDEQGNWLCGSFSGLFLWNRECGRITDYFTGDEATDIAGPPFGKFAVAGYSDDFKGEACIAEYNSGTHAIVMPDTLSTLPISLWNLALEVHTGRIYTFLGQGTLIYIFFTGLIALWCLWTGYRIRIRKKSGQK